MMHMTATQLVEWAEKSPEVWHSDNQHEDEVIFANGMYSVGSNGDVADYFTASEAVSALEHSWANEDNHQ